MSPLGLEHVDVTDDCLLHIEKRVLTANFAPSEFTVPGLTVLSIHQCPFLEVSPCVAQAVFRIVDRGPINDSGRVVLIGV